MPSRPPPTVSAALLRQRGLIRVDGTAARSFLQGLVTNDVEKVDKTTPVYAALLTPQGKFLHDFLIIQIGESLFLDIERERTADLLKRLKMYRLRAPVELEDVTQAWIIFAIFGEGAGVMGDRMPGTAVRDPRNTALGLRLYCQGDPCQDIESFGIPIVDVRAYDALRVAAGVPDGSRDIPVEKAFPLEYGFNALDAVSYDKGCYIGQELTAKTHNRGKVKKGLYRVRFENQAPDAGTAIVMGSVEVGEVLSGAGDFALAHLRIDAAETSQPLVAGKSSIVERVEAPVAPSG